MEPEALTWDKAYFMPGPDSRESFIPLDNPALKPLREKGLFMCGYSRLRPPYRLGRPDPMINMVQFTLSGSGRLRSENGHTLLTKGSMLLVPAGLAHALAIEGDEWEIIWFHFGAVNFWAPAWEKTERIEQFSDFNRMERTVHDLLTDLNSPFPLSSRLAEHMAQVLVILLDRKLHTYGNPHQYTLFRQFDLLWDKVNASLAGEWTVDHMAREMNLSASHFSRLCREIHGLSPSRKLRRFRLDRAKALLIHHDYTVYQVAEMVGYGDPFAFSTAFKEYTGKTPREWRCL